LSIIDEGGENLGEMSKYEALNLAREKGLDLVEINPTNRPPICKIMDFGKLKYDQAKKVKEAKAHSRATELKEMRLTFKISSHDIEYKAKQAREFFDRGDAVKVSMRLRGRENAFFQQAFQVFQSFADVAGLSYERPPQKSGNQITAFMTAKKEEEHKSSVTNQA